MNFSSVRRASTFLRSTTEGKWLLTRFYFDLVHNDTVLSDDKGAEASDLQEAIELAIQGVAELNDSGEADDFGGGWMMLIRDESGTVFEKLQIQ